MNRNKLEKRISFADMSISQDLATFSKAISDDIEHGASHILKIAAGSLHTSLLKNPNATPLEIKGAVKEYALRLISGQRQMATILNFCNLLLLELEESKDETALGKNLREYSLSVTRDSTEAMAKIAAHAEKAIEGSQFMTHSRSSTLLHFLIRMRGRAGLITYVTQSRPGAEGRLLAGELAVAGIPTILIEDAESMKYLARTSALLVGADAVIPGGVVNKVGTHMMALAAKELGIPVYCLTETTKIWPFDEPIIRSISMEQSAPISGGGVFEMIPGSAFKAIILESGPVAFDKISINRENIKIAPEIRKLVGL